MPEDSDEEIDIVVKYDKPFRTLDELDQILIEGQWSCIFKFICKKDLKSWKNNHIL